MFSRYGGARMRRFITLACASVLGISLSAAYVAQASAAARTPGSGGTTIVVSPGQSIQAAVNQARPGDTVLVRAGVYRQSVQIRTDNITLRGSGNSVHGTVLIPPAHKVRSACNAAFGPTGVCVLAKQVGKNGAVIQPVRGDTIQRLYVAGFGENGVFGYGTDRMTVTHVTAVRDGGYGISRFVSTRTLFAHDVAIGNDEAGFYVGDSPDAATVVAHNIAQANTLGIFIRHARGVAVTGNLAVGNCQGILVLDDGQRGGAGNAVIQHNVTTGNNKFCPKNDDTPVDLQGGGILLLGATNVLVTHNLVTHNAGRQFNSGGIVVLSARQLTHGHNPKNILVTRNTLHRNRPFDLRWDGTGTNVAFVKNRCATSSPAGLCSR
jgi:hypothetical protein